MKHNTSNLAAAPAAPEKRPPVVSGEHHMAVVGDDARVEVTKSVHGPAPIKVTAYLLGPTFRSIAEVYLTDENAVALRDALLALFPVAPVEVSK